MTTATDKTVTDKKVRSMVRRWLTEWAPDLRLHTVTLLGGGVSASVYGVEYTAARVRRRVALRLVDAPLNLCLRESMVLNRLHAAGVPVAQCFGVKERAGEGCAMLLDWLPGQTVRRPKDVGHYVHQLSGVLADIHAQEPLHGLPKFATVLNRWLRHAADVDQLAPIVRVLKANAPDSSGVECLLHGDFWPENILFKRKQLVGVVDWQEACVGPRMADVANARMEILWLWGEEAMHEFTHSYFSFARVKAYHLAYWDLVATLKPALYGQNWGLSVAQYKRLQAAVQQTQQQSLLTLGI